MLAGSVGYQNSVKALDSIRLHSPHYPWTWTLNKSFIPILLTNASQTENFHIQIVEYIYLNVAIPFIIQPVLLLLLLVLKVVRE